MNYIYYSTWHWLRIHICRITPLTCIYEQSVTKKCKPMQQIPLINSCKMSPTSTWIDSGSYQSTTKKFRFWFLLADSSLLNYVIHTIMKKLPINYWRINDNIHLFADFCVNQVYSRHVMLVMWIISFPDINCYINDSESKKNRCKRKIKIRIKEQQNTSNYPDNILYLWQLRIFMIGGSF